MHPNSDTVNFDQMTGRRFLLIEMGVEGGLYRVVLSCFENRLDQIMFSWQTMVVQRDLNMRTKDVPLGVKEEMIVEW